MCFYYVVGPIFAAFCTRLVLVESVSALQYASVCAITVFVLLIMVEQTSIKGEDSDSEDEMQVQVSGDLSLSVRRKYAVQENLTQRINTFLLILVEKSFLKVI